MVDEPTVFVVDDDPGVRQVLRRLIASVGLRVEVHESANAFLEAYKPGIPGCILLDIVMPGMSGFQLQKELAKRNIELPIIFLTSYGKVEVAVHAIKAGAVDFIEKPFNNQMLLDRIQQTLAESAGASRDNA